MHFSKLLLAALAAPILAHPGEKHDPHVLKREIHARDAFANMGKRALDACSTSWEARRLIKKNVQRRAERVNALREKGGFQPVSPPTVNHSRTSPYELISFAALPSYPRATPEMGNRRAQQDRCTGLPLLHA